MNENCGPYARSFGRKLRISSTSFFFCEFDHVDQGERPRSFATFSAMRSEFRNWICSSELQGFAEVAHAVNPNSPGIQYFFRSRRGAGSQGPGRCRVFRQSFGRTPREGTRDQGPQGIVARRPGPDREAGGRRNIESIRDETSAPTARPRPQPTIADDDAQPITLLHVSDMQFGRNHRFGRLGAYDPDASFDTLLQRLTDDLDGLKQDHNLIPQIVVASGDLAEWGLPGEFEQAREFLDRVAHHLGLGHERDHHRAGKPRYQPQVVAGPFLMAEAKGKAPIPPFWPKWEDYAEMFKDFYGGPSPGFTVAEPWTWYEIADLKVVIAGLNSTISEIHNIPESDPNHEPLIKSGAYGHFGRVGEEQLRWFAGKLKPFKERGVFRIGVVHHNVLRGAVADDENLRDAERLGQFLGGSLNLLLHGHTHNSKIGWLNPSLPVLSTGSAAAAQYGPARERPQPVPGRPDLARPIGTLDATLRPGAEAVGR